MTRDTTCTRISVAPRSHARSNDYQYYHGHPYHCSQLLGELAVTTRLPKAPKAEQSQEMPRDPAPAPSAAPSEQHPAAAPSQQHMPTQEAEPEGEGLSMVLKIQMPF